MNNSTTSKSKTADEFSAVSCFDGATTLAVGIEIIFLLKPTYDIRVTSDCHAGLCLSFLARNCQKVRTLKKIFWAT